MSKDTGPAEFVVNVPGEGVFKFRKRTMRTQISIECEYTRLTEGVPAVTDFLARLAGAFADLTVLTVEAPKGWDLDELDGFDDDDYARLTKVWEALRGQEATFRQAGGAQAPREGEGGDVRAVVPADVPPGSD